LEKGEPVGERRRENKKNRGDEEGEAEGEEEFGHGVGRGFIWEWMAEGFGFGEAVFFEDGSCRGRFDVREEGESGVFVGASF